MYGLNRIDAGKGTITSYYATDGIGGNQFTRPGFLPAV
jgi:hypothetical protein